MNRFYKFAEKAIETAGEAGKRKREHAIRLEKMGASSRMAEIERAQAGGTRRTRITQAGELERTKLKGTELKETGLTPKELADVRSKAFGQLQTEWERMNTEGLWTHPLEKDTEGNFRPLTAGEITKEKRKMHDELVGRYTGDSGKETRMPETKGRGWLTTAGGRKFDVSGGKVTEQSRLDQALAGPDQYYGGELPRISPPSLSGLSSAGSTTRAGLMPPARELTPAGTPRVSPPLKGFRQMFGEEKRAITPMIESFKKRWKKRKRYPATFSGLRR